MALYIHDTQASNMQTAYTQNRSRHAHAVYIIDAIRGNKSVQNRVSRNGENEKLTGYNRM